MAKNKNKGKKANQRKIYITVPQQPAIVLTKAAKEYVNSLSEEEKNGWEPTSSLDVAHKAGIVQRISLLGAAYYHIHAIQGFLSGEICNWLDKYGLWIKGMRQAMNDVERIDDRFYKTMSAIFKDTKNYDQQIYRQDVDSLHQKFMRWEGIPVHWNIGDKQKVHPPIEGDNSIVLEKNNEYVKIGTVTLSPETTHKKLAYCVSRLNEDESATVVKESIKNKGLAIITANAMAKAEPGQMFVVYEQKIKTQEVTTLVPLKAVQTPLEPIIEGAIELVSVDL